MSKFHPFLFIIILSFVQFAHSQTFTQKADFPEISARAFSFCVSGNLYVGTGIDSNLVMSSNIFQYNLANNEWKKMSSFPGGKSRNNVSLVINGKGYAGLGVDGSKRIGWYEYNHEVDTWKLRNSDCDAGQFGGTFTLNGKGYVVCGSGKNEVHNQLWEYDPGEDSWSRKANFPGQERDLLFAESVGNFGYAGLGDGFFAAPFFDDIYKYDPIVDSWDSIPPIPLTPSGGKVQGGVFTSASYDGKIILMNLGFINTLEFSEYNSIFVYNTNDESWTYYHDVNKAGLRGEPFFAQFKHKLFIGAGWNETYYTDLWEVDLASFITSVEDSYPEISSLKLSVQNKMIFISNPDSDVKKENYVICIYSTDGKPLIQYQLKDDMTIDVSHLPAGIYFYNINSNKMNIKSGKFMLY
ncbi:MAG: T9SS type A sorting domain-containing protein [Saprospiraceae bacterium]|nr:T9SS type A sorting domain-containing protein [Saprospiraceae bacterium]